MVLVDRLVFGIAVMVLEIILMLAHLMWKEKMALVFALPKSFHTALCSLK
jgi:hypothetical protein